MKFKTMKTVKYILILIFGLTVASCESDKKGNTPDAVKKAFKVKYPDENDPDWRKDKNGNYESHFKKDGDHFRADFSPAGNWIETEQSIKKKKLPDAILKILEADYSDSKIVEIEKVDHHTKGVFYDVELKKDGDKRDIEVRENGTIMN